MSDEIIAVKAMQDELVHSWRSYCQRGENASGILKLPQIINSLTPSDLIKFTLKSDAQVPVSNPTKYISSIIFKDLRFNVRFQNEFNSDPLHNYIGLELRKTFCFINRVKFTHPVYPTNADISIVKSLKKDKGYRYIPEYAMIDAGIFDNSETYEIKLELDKDTNTPIIDATQEGVVI